MIDPFRCSHNSDFRSLALQKSETYKKMLVETTPKRKASDGDIDTKHTKKSKKNNHAKRTAIYAVLMRNGDVNDFKKLKDKNEFVEENKEIALETKDFRTTKDFKEWKKMKEAIPVSPKTAKKEEGENGLIKMSPDDAKKVHKCVSMVNDLKPADGIYVYWKTTSTSSAAGVVIRFLDKSKLKLSETGRGQNRNTIESF